MASIRVTFILDLALTERARQLDVNISAAAREGVVAAVRAALADADRVAYQQMPERSDPLWADTESWGD